MEDEVWIILRAPPESIDSFGTFRISPEVAAGVRATIESIPASAIGDLVADPATVAASPDMPTALISPFVGSSASSGDAWGIAAVGADASAYDGAGVRVAVLDTGIDGGHPCFKGVSLVQRDFSGAGNGDVVGHGTHCAGTLFGRDLGGRIGIACGVTDALVGKVLDDSGHGTAMMAIRGLQWAAQEGARVISMSLGFDVATFVARLVSKGWDPKLAASRGLDGYRRSIRVFDRQISLLSAQAALGQEALVIAASGNESDRGSNPDFRVPASLPAAAEGVVSVGAVGRTSSGLKIADFSNSLPTLCGPGVGIRSAWPGGGSKILDGTSMACPHVAGLAALWWQALGPQATAELVSLRLKGAAGHAGLAPGFDHTDVGLGLARAP